MPLARDQMSAEGERSNAAVGKQATVAHQTIGATRKRYIILLLFCLNTANKAFQWIQISSNTTKAATYYQVDNYVINLTSMVFMINFLLFSWPACYVIQRIGIRNSILCASFGTILGTCIKCSSCLQASASLLLLGQFLVAASEQLVHEIPARIASVWFPDNEVSTCLAICVLGNQLGMAAGFLLPQWILQDTVSSAEIGDKFSQLFLITLAYSIVMFVANWCLLDEAPGRPPGLARQRQIALERAAKQSDSSAGSVGHLAGQVLRQYRNRDLVLISISFGLNYSRSTTISTLLDQTIKPIFPNSPTLVGNIGSLIIVSGALGSALLGRLIDKWRAYKAINLAIVGLAGAALALFAYLLIYAQSELAVYVGACLFGFFQSACFVSAIDFAVELTYPASEMVTWNVLYYNSSILGPIFIMIGSYVVDNHGPLAANLVYLFTLVGSFVCVLLCRERLRRQEAIGLESKEMKHLQVI